MVMKIFKFGGASVKDAASVRNLASILNRYNEEIVVVVSAMGKMTNALEQVLAHYILSDERLTASEQIVIDFHYNIVNDLFPKGAPVYELLSDLFLSLHYKLKTEPSLTYNFEYDQIVPYGELFSTVIVSEFLKKEGLPAEWIDIRKYLRTDNSFREAKVNFDLSEGLIKKAFQSKVNSIRITQGFIGSTPNNLTTTLGREGSDYTAALLAYFLDAESVTVWKDVPGVLNADPKYFDNTVKLEEISFADAIELAFYGTSVIHPKTIQPLKQKNIPLWVKSFVQPEERGTVVGNVEYKSLIPCFIFKMNQVLIDIFPTDLSFIAEDNLQVIFASFSKYALRVNLMQNTAVHFRICVNNDESRLSEVVKELKDKFQVSLQKGLELITIRYYDQATIDRVMVNKEMILEQRNKSTVQLLVVDLG
jgi:aspartate kinase